MATSGAVSGGGSAVVSVGGGVSGCGIGAAMSGGGELTEGGAARTRYACSHIQPFLSPAALERWSTIALSVRFFALSVPHNRRTGIVRAKEYRFQLPGHRQFNSKCRAASYFRFKVYRTIVQLHGSKRCWPVQFRCRLAAW